MHSLACKGINSIPSQTNMRLRFYNTFYTSFHACVHYITQIKSCHYLTNKFARLSELYRITSVQRYPCISKANATTNISSFLVEVTQVRLAFQSLSHSALYIGHTQTFQKKDTILSDPKWMYSIHHYPINMNVHWSMRLETNQPNQELYKISVS